MNDPLLALSHAAKFAESLKEKFGAKGNGLGECVHDVENRLTPELTKKLLWINRIRNEAAHSPEPDSFQGTHLN